MKAEGTSRWYFSYAFPFRWSIRSSINLMDIPVKRRKRMAGPSQDRRPPGKKREAAEAEKEEEAGEAEDEEKAEKEETEGREGGPSPPATHRPNQKSHSPK